MSNRLPYAPGILGIINPDPNWRVQILAGTSVHVDMPLSALVGLSFPRLLTASADGGQLLVSDSVVYVANDSGGNFPVIPPANPYNGQTIELIDYLGNATDTRMITFQGMLQPNDQVNPSLISIGATWAIIQYFNGAWRLIG